MKERVEGRNTNHKTRTGKETWLIKNKLKEKEIRKCLFYYNWKSLEMKLKFGVVRKQWLRGNYERSKNKTMNSTEETRKGVYSTMFERALRRRWSGTWKQNSAWGRLMNQTTESRHRQEQSRELELTYWLRNKWQEGVFILRSYECLKGIWTEISKKVKATIFFFIPSLLSFGFLPLSLSLVLPLPHLLSPLFIISPSL